MTWDESLVHVWTPAVEEVDDVGRNLLVHRLGPQQGQRPFVMAALVRHRSVGRLAEQHRTRRRQASCCLGVDGAGNLSQARDRRVLARLGDGLLRRGAVDVGEAHLLHGIEVIKVAPIFLEPVRRGEQLGGIAKMVLAKLAGGVAEVVEELGECRRAGPQIGWAPGNFRQNHADAHRLHAGDEGSAPRRAALLGVVGHELGALMADAVDVGRLTDHQALMVDARLHPADVIAHDEQDVRLLLRLRGREHGAQRHGGNREHAEQGFTSRLHDFLLVDFVDFTRTPQAPRISPLGASPP